MNFPPIALWTLSRILAGLDVNGHVDDLDDAWRRIARHLVGLDVAARPAALEGMLPAIPRGDELIMALADTAPMAPEPTEEARKFANGADVRRIMTTTKWLWEGWIPAAKIFGVAGPEGVGKTRFMLDIHSRAWDGKPWPDNTAMTIPSRTPLLWICTDGQQDEIVDDMEEFGIPDEGIIFTGPPDDPYANTSLDDPETLEAIAAAIETRKPGMVILDSLTYATTRDLCDQRTIASLKVPLVNIVQTYQIPLALLMHVSMDGEALGKRIKGITRTLIHLKCPDPEKPERLRLWVQKSFSRKPDALGVTLGSNGNTYDFDPPPLEGTGDRGRPGPKPAVRDKAKQFLRDSLTEKNDQVGNDLCHKWEKSGGSHRTFWRAVEALQEAGELTREGGPGTGHQVILHLIPPNKEPS